MLVAIVGAGRNGSTLLARLLDGSPDLWVHPLDLNYLSLFSDLKKFGRVREQTRVNATVEKPLDIEGTLETGMLLRLYESHADSMTKAGIEAGVKGIESGADPLRRIRDRKQYGAREFLPDFLQTLRDHFDDRREKNPDAALLFKTIGTPFVDEYAEAFPTMRFIHIFRDPVTNYSSLKRTNMIRKSWPFWQHGGDVLRTLLHHRWIPHARSVVERFAADKQRHFVVRYEDLCERPAATVLEICRWLGIRPPAMPETKTVMGGKMSSEFGGYSSQKGIATPSQVSRNMADEFEYENVLTPREEQFIALTTHDLAEHLGYKGNIAPGRLRLALKWLLPDRSELMNATFSPALIAALWRRRIYIYRSIFGGRQV